MFSKKKLNSLFLYLVTFSFLVLFKYIEIFYLSLHNYFTNVHYFNLIEEVQSNDFVFNFENLILVSIKNIFSAEPILAIIYYLFGFIFNNYYTFYFSSFTFFIVTIFFISKLENKFIFTLFTLPLFFGFYEFVLFSLTHRLKFAIIFFLISLFFLLVKKNNKYFFYFFLLSFFTHFSVLIFLPFVFLHFKLTSKDIANRILMLIFFVFFSIFLLNFVFDITEYYYFKKIFTYINYDFDVIFSLLFLMILLLYILTNILKFNFYLFFLINILFIVFVTFILGTGRTLMMFYFFFYFYNLFSNLSNSSRSNTKTIVLNVNNVIFIPFYIYNLFNGFSNNPMFNSSGSFIF